MANHPPAGKSMHGYVTDFLQRYLPEAAHPYYVLKKNGYEVDFASPKGNLMSRSTKH
jgi:hypothetical protein